MGIEVAALAVTAIGAGIAAYSSYQQGQAQASAASYQSAVASNNAALAQNNANLARRDAALTEAQAADEQSVAIRRSRALIGSQVASTAARGVLVDDGSALDIRSGAADIANEEAQNIRETGARRSSAQRIQAFNYEQQAAFGGAQASLYNDQASGAMTSAWLGVGSSLLRGAGSVYSQYSDMARTGVSFSGTPVVS